MRTEWKGWKDDEDAEMGLGKSGMNELEGVRVEEGAHECDRSEEAREDDKGH